MGEDAAVQFAEGGSWFLGGVERVVQVWVWVEVRGFGPGGVGVLGAAGEGVRGDLFPELDGLADAAGVSREGQVRVREFRGGRGFWGVGRRGGLGLFVGGQGMDGQGAGGGGAGELQAEVSHFQAGGKVFGSVLRLGWVGWVVWDGVQGWCPGFVRENIGRTQRGSWASNVWRPSGLVELRRTAAFRLFGTAMWFFAVLAALGGGDGGFRQTAYGKLAYWQRFPSSRTHPAHETTFCGVTS